MTKNAFKIMTCYSSNINLERLLTMQKDKRIQGLGGLRGVAIIAIFSIIFIQRFLKVDSLEFLSFSL